MRLGNPAAIIGEFVNVMLVLMESLVFWLTATRTVFAFVFVESPDSGIGDIVCALPHISASIGWFVECFAFWPTAACTTFVLSEPLEFFAFARTQFMLVKPIANWLTSV